MTHGSSTKHLYNKSAKQGQFQLVRAANFESREEIIGHFLPDAPKYRESSGDWWHFCWYVESFEVSLKDQRFLVCFKVLKNNFALKIRKYQFSTLIHLMI